MKGKNKKQEGKMRDEVVHWKQQQEKSEKQAGHFKSTPFTALFSSVSPFVSKGCFTNILPGYINILLINRYFVSSKNKLYRGVLIQLDGEEQETGSQGRSLVTFSFPDTGSYLLLTHTSL